MAVIALPFEKLRPLRVGDYVYFTENWKPADVFANKYFVVKGTLLKVFDKYFIINSGGYYDFVLDDDSGLMPTSSGSLYEIFVGMKGIGLVYVMFPETDYMSKLEKTGFIPDYTDDTKRYIGFFEPNDTPFSSPRVVFYTTEDMDHIKLRFYNDTDTPQKVVVRFNVNHCKIEQVATVPTGVEVKTILHWRDIRNLGL